MQQKYSAGTGLVLKIHLVLKIGIVKQNYKPLQRSGPGRPHSPARKGGWWVAVTATRDHTISQRRHGRCNHHNGAAKM
jgi:hypothetical protein